MILQYKITLLDIYGWQKTVTKNSLSQQQRKTEHTNIPSWINPVSEGEQGRTRTSGIRAHEIAFARSEGKVGIFRPHIALKPHPRFKTLQV